MTIMMETDLQTLLRGATALGNLCHKNDDARAQVQSLGFSFPSRSAIVAADGEKDVEVNKTTIAEIAAMLGIQFA